FEDTLALLRDHRIVPSRLKAQYADDQRLTYLPFLLLLNKHDDPSFDEYVEIFSELIPTDDWLFLSISAATGYHLDRLKHRLVERLEIIRVYSKIPGKEPDFTAPFLLKKGDTVEIFAGKVHHDFLEHLKTARVWGQDVYDGQMVQRDHILHDRDIVELHL
ncbi:TGS domain-containing protein, partial [candidate division KSB3 bacterium]|nr:TGS domain-containing protein [candidate division KSB3 bacterium]MBD3326427.1 TGS domain-containing protein [candidate division KSB3 bacterium]